MYDRSTIIVTRLLSLPDNIRALLSVARPSNTRHNIIIIHSNWRFFPAYFFAFCRIVIDIPRAATAVLCLLTLRKTHLQFEQFRVGTFEASESIFFASRASHDTADGKFASKPFSFDRSKNGGNSLLKMPFLCPNCLDWVLRLFAYLISVYCCRMSTRMNELSNSGFSDSLCAY